MNDKESYKVLYGDLVYVVPHDEKKSTREEYSKLELSSLYKNNFPR